MYLTLLHIPREKWLTGLQKICHWKTSWFRFQAAAEMRESVQLQPSAKTSRHIRAASFKKCQLPDIRRATVECYAGNCSRCPMDSLVCSGLSVGSWWLKSVYLSTHEITYLQMDENDKGLLETLLEMHLSEEAIKKVSSGTSTQKCEAFNRSTSATIRKEVNFSKNFEGRVHSAAQRINNTLGESLKEKLLFVTGTPLSSKTLEALGQISKRSEYLKSTEQMSCTRGDVFVTVPYWRENIIFTAKNKAMMSRNT